MRHRVITDQRLITSFFDLGLLSKSLPPRFGLTSRQNPGPLVQIRTVTVMVVSSSSSSSGHTKPSYISPQISHHLQNGSSNFVFIVSFGREPVLRLGSLA